MKKNVSERVKGALDVSGLSDIDVANIIGVSETTVWRWRTGRTQKFTSSTLRNIAKTLQVDYEYLRTGESRSNINELMKTYTERKDHSGFSDKERDLLLEFLIAQTEVVLKGLHRLKGDPDG